MTASNHLQQWHNSHWWCDFFRAKEKHLIDHPWEWSPPLSAAEKRLVAASLQEFQQGEGLEGRHYFRVVAAEARQSGDLEYAEAHRLFMSEEQRHARDLGAFLDREEIPRLPADSPRNWLFRWLGSRGGFELTAAIILHIEIIAQAYYAALAAATASPLLRSLCTQILRDEAMHVRFQCQRLAYVRRRRSPAGMWLTNVLDYLLFVGAWLVCYWGHHRVLRAGGQGTIVYWRKASAHRRRAAAMKDPWRYAAFLAKPAAERSSRCATNCRVGPASVTSAGPPDQQRRHWWAGSR
jgi:hypothetical protein